MTFNFGAYLAPSPATLYCTQANAIELKSIYNSSTFKFVKTLWVGCDEGLFKSIDGGETFVLHKADWHEQYIVYQPYMMAAYSNNQVELVCHQNGYAGSCYCFNNPNSVYGYSYCALGYKTYYHWVAHYGKYDIKTAAPITKVNSIWANEYGSLLAGFKPNSTSVIQKRPLTYKADFTTTTFYTNASLFVSEDSGLIYSDSNGNSSVALRSKLVPSLSAYVPGPEVNSVYSHNYWLYSGLNGYGLSVLVPSIGGHTNYSHGVSIGLGSMVVNSVFPFDIQSASTGLNTGLEIIAGTAPYNHKIPSQCHSDTSGSVASGPGGVSILLPGQGQYTNKTKADGLGSNYVYSVAAIENGAQTKIFAGTGNGLSVSVDNGKTFVNYAPPGTNPVLSEQCPTDASIYKVIPVGTSSSPLKAYVAGQSGLYEWMQP